MAQQFVYNSQTGQVGYWAGPGSEVIPLPKSMASDPAGAQQLLDMVTKAEAPPKFTQMAPDEQATIEKLYAVTRPKSVQAAQPGMLDRLLAGARKVGTEFAPKELLTGAETLEAERIRQQGMTPGAIGKDIAMEVISAVPAILGGKAAATGLKALMPGGPVSRIGRLVERGVTGAGAALGDIAGQKTGIVSGEGDDLISAGVAGAMGALAGPGRPGQPRAVSAGERSARKTAAAQPIRTAGIREGEEAMPSLHKALSGADVDTKKILKPVEDVIIKERAHRPIPKSGGQTQPGNARDNIINELERITRDMGDKLSVLGIRVQPGAPIPQTPTPKTTGAVPLPTPARIQIPPIAASEAVAPSMKPGLQVKKAPEPSAYGTPAVSAPSTIAPARAKVLVGAKPTMAAAESVINNVQAMRRLRDQAYKADAPDLAHDIDIALKQVRQTIPGYEEFAAKYSKSKGYQEGARLISRSGDAPNAVRTWLDGPRAKTFSEPEKRKIIRAAERSIGVDWALSQMLQHPLGSKFVAMGITPKGELISSALHAGTQVMGKTGLTVWEALQGGQEDENP